MNPIRCLLRPLLLGPLVAFATAWGAAAGALPRATPESQGISSAAVLKFVENADARIDSLHGLMIVRHGKVIAEGWWTPYSPTNRHELYSLSKSFTSTAVGIAIDEGKLGLDDEVLKFFPDQAPSKPSEGLKAMRVRDLLSMSTGHQDEPPMTLGTGPTVKAFLEQPVPHKPGTHFKYNTPATYMLSAIVQKVTGQTVLDYLRPRLFEPLGIPNPTWGTSSEGVSLGGYGLNISTEDIARFGQMLLQHGRWDGRQLVSEGWVAAATARQTSNGSNPRSDWDQGYGYQFWRCRHGAFRGDGAFGQYCLVLPDQDTVIAITAGVRNMQAVLDRVWEDLLPAFQPRRLRADRTTQERLLSRLSGLRLRTPTGTPSSSMGAQVGGRTYAFDTNEARWNSARLEGPSADVTTLALDIAGTERRWSWKPGEWTRTRFPYNGVEDAPAAVSGAWEAPDTLALRICFYETPFVVTYRLRFSGDAASSVTVQREANVGFGPAKSPDIVGHVRP